MMHYVKHVFFAFGYSMKGLKRLWQEKAARIEIICFVGQCALYWLLGAAFHHYIFLLLSFLFILALEALNTAVEVLTDHLTDSYALFAAHAKDLGSFAVFCGLLAQMGLTSWVFYTHWPF